MSGAAALPLRARTASSASSRVASLSIPFIRIASGAVLGVGVSWPSGLPAIRARKISYSFVIPASVDMGAPGVAGLILDRVRAMVVPKGLKMFLDRCLMSSSFIASFPP